MVGFGNHMARPLFREKHTDDMSEALSLILINLYPFPLIPYPKP
jgi:hypothetical protein